jgi:hypothetical protein
MQRLSEEQPIISKLLRDKKPLELTQSQRAIEGLPQGFMQPLLAIPLCAHREVLAVVLYSSPRRRSD